jgi:hypothetical protein
MAHGEAHVWRSGRHLDGVGRVVEEQLARDGPEALRMSCLRSGQGIGTRVTDDGDWPPDWSREPGVSAGAWAGDGRPGSTSESQIKEAVGDGVGKGLEGQGGEWD